MRPDGLDEILQHAIRAIGPQLVGSGEVFAFGCVESNLAEVIVENGGAVAVEDLVEPFTRERILAGVGQQKTRDSAIRKPQGPLGATPEPEPPLDF